MVVAAQRANGVSELSPFDLHQQCLTQDLASVCTQRREWRVCSHLACRLLCGGWKAVLFLTWFPSASPPRDPRLLKNTMCAGELTLRLRREGGPAVWVGGRGPGVHPAVRSLH